MIGVSPLASLQWAAGRTFSIATENIKPTHGLNFRRDDVTGLLSIGGHS